MNRCMEQSSPVPKKTAETIFRTNWKAHLSCLVTDEFYLDTSSQLVINYTNFTLLRVKLGKFLGIWRCDNAKTMDLEWKAEQSMK